MSPEEIVIKFAEALKDFECIVGQPTDKDLTCLRECLFCLLLAIPYNEEQGTHNLIGLIADEADYARKYGARFLHPFKLPIYDTTISDDAKAVTQARMEAEHRVKRADYKTYTMAERETKDFILAVVEDTWVRELKDSSTFYSLVTARELLKHLQSTCTGLHALDVLTLQNEMQKYHVEVEGVPEYINMLEDAQK